VELGREGGAAKDVKDPSDEIKSASCIQTLTQSLGAGAFGAKVRI
jgi:hypothetical protein